jgi:predicted ribosome quality control (RQC) complex YloA/Tae2 family protein
MEIRIDLKKTLEQNASDYFEKGKKAKSKIDNIKKTIALYQDKLTRLEKEQFKLEEESKKEKRTPRWYEKFRWFITSEGFLAVGGRDAGSNELIIKKHMEPNDLVFHTEAAGSPFFILKTEGKQPTERSIQEVADATYIFSKSFKGGVGGVNSFWVSPEQISTTPKPGEYLERGSFIVNGKKNVIVPRFSLGIGIVDDGAVMCAPLSAVKKNCKKYLELIQSRGAKPSDLAKKIRKKIGGDLDEIVRVLPAGNIGLK